MLFKVLMTTKTYSTEEKQMVSEDLFLFFIHFLTFLLLKTINEVLVEIYSLNAFLLNINVLDELNKNRVENKRKIYSMDEILLNLTSSHLVFGVFADYSQEIKQV